MLEFLEMKPDSSVPTFINMTAESLPSDNMVILVKTLRNHVQK